MKEQDINTNGEINYINKQTRARQSITNTSVQFQIERIDKKVNHLKSKFHNTPAPNQYQRREGYTLTPLMEGRIQYGLLKKADNTDAVRGELLARDVDIRATTGWMIMISMLKDNEKTMNASAHPKYFVPATVYDNFTINSNNA